MLIRAHLESKSENEVLLFSLDGDDCLFNLAYEAGDAKDEKSRVLAANALLIEDLKRLLSENKHAKKVFMVGSNRQSQPLDKDNSKNYTPPSTSIFHALNIVSDECAGEIDPLLLSDIYYGREAGYNFKTTASNDHAPWDKSKIILLYLQMQHAAFKYPGKKIALHFYDDDDDILMNLFQFYWTYPNLIPANVTIHLHPYDGISIRHYLPIKSSNQNHERDLCYIETVKDLLQQVGKDEEEQIKPSQPLALFSKVLSLHEEKQSVAEMYTQFRKEEMPAAKKTMLRYEMNNLLKIPPAPEVKDKEEKGSDHQAICMALKNIIFNTDWDIWIGGETEAGRVIPKNMLAMWRLIQAAQTTGNWSGALGSIQERATVARSQWSFFRSKITKQFYHACNSPRVIEQMALGM